MKLIDDGDHHKKTTDLEPYETATTPPRIGVAWWHRARPFEPTGIVSIFTLTNHGIDAQFHITPSQARQFAAQLLAHADEVEQAEKLRQQMEAIPA